MGESLPLAVAKRKRYRPGRGRAHTGGFDYNRAMAQTLGAQLAPLTALDELGQAVSLGGFWQSQPVVLAFVRHFG